MNLYPDENLSSWKIRDTYDLMIIVMSLQPVLTWFIALKLGDCVARAAQAIVYLFVLYISLTIIRKFSFAVCICLLMLSLIGLVTYQNVLPLLALLQVLSYIAMFGAISNRYSTRALGNLVLKVIFWNIFVIFSCSLANVYISGANPLITIVQIILPAWMLCLLIVRTSKTSSTRIVGINLVLQLIVFALLAIQAIEFGVFRPQYLSYALFVIIVFAWLRLYFLDKFSVGIVLFLLSLVIFVTHAYLGVSYLQDRLVSLQIRLLLFFHTFLENLFIIPMGIGSGEKVYSISEEFLLLNGVRISRDIFPPHSGFSIILNEFGLPLALFLILTVTKGFKRYLSSNNQEATTATRLYRFDFLKKTFLVFFFIQNLFYINGIPSTHYFSDNGLVLYGLCWLLLSAPSTYYQDKRIDSSQV